MAASTETLSPADAATNSGDGRKKTVGRVVMGVLALGAAYGAYSLYGYQTVGRYMQETNDAYVKADGVAVSSKLAGYVRAVPVAENQAIAAGGLLVQIDPSDFSTRLAQASAQVEVARATEAATLASINEARSAVGQAQAALAASQRDLAYLNGEVTRFRPLVVSGAEPRQMLDQLTANRDKASADVSAKQAMLEAANDRVVSARAQAGQSAAQIKAAQAQRDAAGNDLGTTRITAPVAGRIGNSTVRVGQFVQPGQRLMTIVPTQALYVEANFKETQIGLMRAGQPVKISVDALPDVDFHGTVESITPGTGANFSMIPPQNATGNFTKIVQRVPVRIRLNAGPESRKVLVPGLSLTVEVDTRSAKSAVEAIRKEQEQVAK
ncbi:MAG: multidrug ABC transporter permease [Novosphingobium sp. 32-60-15]|uniref:HlyD family secretion protein n=1 Tax=unclassified Novosphingobium TaxID=2644732 RepID=UPI000BD6779D|nr:MULTISPECIES: HlyD family secretion protein [unclassified Novosphingobium]OYX63821.1 MAG: multidrug ABC transporter permease [Novosphingobium sp. 32-60-15]